MSVLELFINDNLDKGEGIPFFQIFLVQNALYMGFLNIQKVKSGCQVPRTA